MKLVIIFPVGPPQVINESPFANDKKLVFFIEDNIEMSRYRSIVNSYGVPDLIVSTAHPDYPELTDNVPWHYFPLYLKRFVSGLDKIVIKDRAVTHCFNFIINKKQVNRYILLKLVEWFNLTSYTHTWSGIGATFDASLFLNDIDKLNAQVNLTQFRTHMLAPVANIPVHFIDYRPITDIQSESSVKNYGGNTWAWNNIVGEMFSQSAVSLITESIAYEKTIMFTEKTMFSVLGLTLPIWVGGYKQAEMWKNHGFDTFDDIVNHNYQYYDSLIERCFYAVHDNLKLLTDVNYSFKIKEQCMDRLIHNRLQLAFNIRKKYKDSLTTILPDMTQYLTNISKYIE